MPGGDESKTTSRTMRVLCSAGLSVSLALAAAACGGGADKAAVEPPPIERGPDIPIVVAAEAPIVVGVSSALTGPVGARGSEYRDAAILAVNRWKETNGDQIAGHEIVVQAEDDGCTEADITVGAANRLLARGGLVGVVGPQCSAGAEAAIPVYNAAGVVAISGSATRTNLTVNQPESRFFFRTAFRNQFEGALTGQFIAEDLEARSVLIVDDGEPYGTDLAMSVAGELTERAVDVQVVSVRQGQADFGTLAARIARIKPDFVGFAGFNPEAALFYRQLRDAGYAGPFGAGDAAASERDFVAPVGAGLAEGVYFAGCSLVLPEDFVADFHDLSGQAPAAAFVAHYADAATILLRAVVAVVEPQADGSLSIDPAALRDAVRATDLGAGGFSGHVRFDQLGDRTSAATDIDKRSLDLGLAGCQVKSGQLVQIYPSPGG